jgi:hypothetical protein
VVDQPENLAVVAKRVQVAGICGDLNDVPFHVSSCLGVCPPGHGAASSSGIERPATADGIAFAHQIIFRTFGSSRFVRASPKTNIPPGWPEQAF